MLILNFFKIKMLQKLFILSFIFLTISCSNKGKQVPEFDVKTLEGKSFSDKNLAGKITVINVWATWCPPCLQEIPSLNALAEKYAQDSSVVFIAFSDESPEKIKTLLSRIAFNFQHIPDASDITSALKTRLVTTYPQLLIIGKDKVIKYEHTGELENCVDVLSKEIEALR